MIKTRVTEMFGVKYQIAGVRDRLVPEPTIPIQTLVR